MNEKARQRNEVVLGLGLLIQPIVELVENEKPPSIAALRVACAKVHSGDARWRESVRALATFAPDVFLNVEFQQLSHTVEVFLRHLRPKLDSAASSGRDDSIREICTSELAKLKERFYSDLDTIPIEWAGEVFQANTPFTSYLKIKDVVVAAQSRLVYFDRYLKPQFYEMFLRGLPPDLQIRLVTTTGNLDYGVKAVLTISELASREFRNYKLIRQEPSAIHDRNLIVDENVFSLGPGVDRAGFALTNFAVADSSEATHAALEEIVRGGEVIHES